MPSHMNLKAIAASGKISRRDFIAYAAAAGVTASMADTIFSSAAHAAKKGGHFKIGIGAGSTTDSLDPGTT